MNWFTNLAKTLPKIRTKLQLTGLIVGVGALIAMRAVVPEATVAQISAGAIAVVFLIFGQVFYSVRDFPGKERVKLILWLFGMFVVFILALVLIIVVNVKKADEKLPNKDYISIGFDGGMPLKDVIALVEKYSDTTIIISNNCKDSLVETIVEGGTHEGSNVKEFLERLRLRIRDNVSFTVNEIGGVRYEINCG